MIKGSRSEIQKKRKRSKDQRSRFQKDQKESKNRDTRKEDKRMTKDQKINLRGSDKYQNRRSSFGKRRLFHDQCGARVQIS